MNLLEVTVPLWAAVLIIAAAIGLFIWRVKVRRKAYNDFLQRRKERKALFDDRHFIAPHAKFLCYKDGKTPCNCSGLCRENC